ncbi:MAG: L-Ala-D/L-Glu epimerase [Syntrophorhabdus sp. PtaB.Bin184]|jgi:L-alanine-DL-glutamate epimerase-like enolase superfamily enzyme|nr:MAG: L-Ala-D/L-Glu epimerase [Syntrophorhabdus sp. PtaB.Bin184]
MANDEITTIHMREVVRPLKTTFSTSLGHKSAMRSVIVEVRLGDGSLGLGECATSFILPHETVDRIRGIIEEERPFLTGKRAAHFPIIAAELRARHPSFPMTVSGLETAIWRAWLRNAGTSEVAWFGDARRRIETDITIPLATDRKALKGWIEQAARKGFTVYKIKVSGEMAHDIRLIASVSSILETLGVRHTLRLDGNQGFTKAGCLAFADHVMRKGYPVELFEQPLRKDNHRGLREVKKRSPFPVILDETVFSAKDMEMALNEDLGHGVNIKIAKSGVTESLSIMKLAKKGGVRLMAGCMTETMTGLSAGIAMAMGTGVFDYIDLDSLHFLHHRKRYGEIVAEGAVYRIKDNDQ